LSQCNKGLNLLPADVQCRYAARRCILKNGYYRSAGELMSVAAGSDMPGSARRRRNSLLALGLAGVAVRVLLWWLSIGSNDAVIWSWHAQHVAADGLAHTYRTYQAFPQFNHPPLMGLWAAQSWVWSHGSLWEFARWLKLPGIAGEALVMCVLWQLAGLRACVVYAWLPAPILVSSFHGSTDCLYAALVLVAAIAFDRERYFLSGLLWSASLNVKLLPLILIPLVFLGVPNRRALLLVVSGLALGMVPFLPTALTAGKAMYQNMLAYNSFPGNWGLMALLNAGLEKPALRSICEPLRGSWMAAGRYVVLLAVVGVAALSRYRRKMLMIEQSALGAALFLILAPGFAPQYVVFVAPLLCVVDFREGVLWGWTSGVFIGALYWTAKVSWMPLQSWLLGYGDFPATVVGMMAWAVLVHFTLVHIRAAWTRCPAFSPIEASRGNNV
jgi:hypothetical protein